MRDELSESAGFAGASAGTDGLDSLSISARWAEAAKVIAQLARTRSLEEAVERLRASARRVVGADGIAVVLRDRTLCHYAAEDAQEPLWAGQRFPMDNCVSGWAMRNNETVVIPDVFVDPRVPQEAYRATFVRSMVMVPIGMGRPTAAIGAYWSHEGEPTPNEIALLEALANAASTGLENARLLRSMTRMNAALEARVMERSSELERAQENLRQTQKMEMIGQLTGNVAHDFNNLLAPIMSTLDLVLGGRARPEVIARNANIAMEAAETAKTLVQRLLAFARRQPLATTAVDLSELVHGMRSLLSSTMGARVTLEVQVDAGLPPVRADKQQLEMAILNLAVNARDAMPMDGTLIVRAGRAKGSGPARLVPGDYVELSVRDTGFGMDEDTLKAATDPFFTTKEAGHGTGLGLSMVDGLASQLGGALDIRSMPGEGTEVRLWLGVAKGALDDDGEEEAEIELGASQGQVLLIDDDALVRMSTADMLTDLGYDVTEAEDAFSGLALIDRGFRPDIVVTDHVMPGMTGAELALRLRADHPEIALMIISGYQGIDLIAPDIVRLSKPFRQAHLGASVVAARAQLH